MLLLAPATCAQPSGGASLHGVVRDGAGKTVGGACVILHQDKQRASQKTTTDTAGRFTFKNVAPGILTLIATSGTLRSSAVAITVSKPGQHPPIDLVLDAAGTTQSASASQDASQAMQFADNPNFSIAAVTDWTAAGGHGSDSILRTSESLTRQAVSLKSGNPGTAASVTGGGSEPKESPNGLQAEVAKDPQGFQPNYRLGAFYLQSSRYRDAIQPLLTAYKADPANYDNEYDLVLALTMTGDYAEARYHLRRLLDRRPSASLHRRLGELDEKLGDPLSAVHQFQDAAGEDPSEDNYFAWGSELLVHRAVWQAKEVFDEGVKLYPQSARMLTARGAALFAGAMYDQAAMDLCNASNLDPKSVDPYLFIGKIEVAAPDPLPCVVTELARFHHLHPSNSLANYYYAMALWKQQGQVTNPQFMDKVEAMLTRAVTLDPKCADAYFQLGNLSAGQKRWDQAIGLYQKAIHANPELVEAHYRLGVAYERAGQEAKAKEQFQLHDSIAKEQAAEIQRQRQAVKQFLVVLPSRDASHQTHE
jgi:tetratricopeptide (TPR) repeat protein